jgi:hypothetical protein
MAGAGTGVPAQQASRPFKIFDRYSGIARRSRAGTAGPKPFPILLCLPSRY